MGFTVKLYTFSKRDNSTKRPLGTAGTEFSCVLKSGSGIMRPTLTFDFGRASDPSQYNYAYISDFDRYYFIEEWYFDRALWTATLKVDVLATYKTEIGNASLYVLRAAGASNGNIVDTLYPCKAGCSFDSETKSNPWNTTPVPVIGVIGKGGVFGSMNYYAMDPSDPTELSTLLSKLLTPTEIINTANDFNDIDASYALQLSLVDPIQYIKTCVMLPVALTDITAIDAAAGIDVYSWNFSTGRKIHPASRIYKNYSFTLKKHPDTNARGIYVNSAPYTKITLTIPPYGCIDIDTSVTCNASTLYVDVEIDPTSGKGILVISCNNIVLNRLEAQIGIPVSLSSVTRDYIGAATSAIGAIGGAVGGFMAGGSAIAGVGGAIAGAATGIGNAIESIMPRAQTIGSTGSFVANRGDFRLDYQFMRPVDDDNTHNGRPLCDVRQISSLSGYILVQDGDVAIAGTSAEDAAVRNYLEGGFYYE